jgi:GNAT superfamily N-acetyltransferase
MTQVYELAPRTVPAPTGHSGKPPQGLACAVASKLRPSDRQALLDLFARSSPQTRHDRFHYALSVFPERYLDDIMEGRQLALVARDACHPESYGMVFGLASAAPVGPNTAEFAVWVDDAWQGHGVGSLLTRGILEALVRNGTRTAIGFVEPGNIAVRRMIRRVAPHHTVREEDGAMVVVIPLGSSPSPQRLGPPSRSRMPARSDSSPTVA